MILVRLFMLSGLVVFMTATRVSAQTTARAVGEIVAADPEHAKGAVVSGEEFQKAIRDRHSFETAVKSVGPFRLEDVIEVTNRSGTLQVEIHPPAVVLDALEPNRLLHVEIEKSDGFWTFGRTVIGEDKKPGSGIEQWSVARFDYDQQCVADGFWFVNATTSTGGINIQNQWNRGAAVYSVNFTQTPTAARLMVVTQTAPGVGGAALIDAEAATLGELEQQHSREVRQYLLPLLRRMTGQDLLGPGAADVYAVFEQIPADPKVTAKLQEALGEMDSPQPSVRVAAERRMRSLGEAGVLAALRCDASKFMAEQRASLERFIGDYRHRAISDPQSARRDAGFLVDSLNSTDINVRCAGKEALEALLGRAVDFDPAADPQVRSKAVDALRAKVNSPATGR